MESDRLLSDQFKENRRLQTSCKLWKTAGVVLSVFFIVAVQALLLYEYVSDQTQNRTTVTNATLLLEEPKGEVSLLNGDFRFIGDSSTESYTDFLGFENLPIEIPDTLISILLQNVHIPDSSSFSESLQRFTELKALRLNNFTMSGDFKRIYFSGLKSFTLNLFIENSDDIGSYQEVNKLHSNLFFDRAEGETWDVKDICNLGVDIIYSVNGFKLIQVIRNKWEGKDEIGLYVPYCKEILQKIQGDYQNLALSTCNITRASIRSSVEYLNLFEVRVSDGSISQLLQNLPRLKKLYVDLPGEFIDLSDIPKSVTLLSLSSFTITYTRPIVLTNANDLSLGFCHLSPEVYANFSEIFPSLERVAAFGHQTANYELLGVLDSMNVDWILMEEFSRNATSLLKDKLDAGLVQIGIPEKFNNFLIKTSEILDVRIGTAFNSTKDADYRYILLGWYSFLTPSAYERASKYDIKG